MNRKQIVIYRNGEKHVRIFCFINNSDAMILVIKFCSKTIKIVLSIIIVLVALYCIIILNRVNSLGEPIFAIVKQETSMNLMHLIVFPTKIFKQEANIWN